MEQLSRAQILEQEEHAQELRERFFEFDVSKTGTLSTDEMTNLVIACFFPAGFADEILGEITTAFLTGAAATGAFSVAAAAGFG